jgi:hypothetical protein
MTLRRTIAPYEWVSAIIIPLKKQYKEGVIFSWFESLCNFCVVLCSGSILFEHVGLTQHNKKREEE